MSKDLQFRIERENKRMEYANYLNSKEWKRKATIIMRKYKHKCVLCGSWATEVHHLTYERVYFEDVRDLIAVCSECHKFIHSIETESYKLF